MSGTSSFLWLIPRNACVIVLRAYRAVVSPLYGDVCRYYPSCSAYALQAIQQRGVVTGMLLASRRIVRCHPWAAGGIDDVPIGRMLRTSPFGFVLPGDGVITDSVVHPSVTMLTGPTRDDPALADSALTDSALAIDTPSNARFAPHGKA